MLGGGLKIELTSEQASKVLQALEGVEKNEYITPDEVTRRLDECMAVLTEEQKSLVASIDLPRRPRPQGAGAPLPGDTRPPPNPFKVNEDELLKGLRTRLSQLGK